MDRQRERARRLSKRMVSAIYVTMVLIAAAFAIVAALAIADPHWLAQLLAAGFGGRVLPFNRFGAVLVLLAYAVQGSILLYALDCLRRAFSAMAQSDQIAEEGGGRLGAAGAAFALNSLIMVLLPAVISLLYSAGAPKGQHFVTVQIGTAELLSLLLSAVLIVTGRLMVLAAAIDDENRQIV